MRSLYEPLGFTDSSLISTSALAADTTRRRHTTGVPPIALNRESDVEVVDIDRSLSRLKWILVAADEGLSLRSSESEHPFTRHTRRSGSGRLLVDNGRESGLSDAARFQ
jgi:hypothetical protein